MTEQLALALTGTSPNAPESKVKPLSERQQALYELVRRTPDGVTRDQAGALMHSMKEGRWAHPADERCDYCVRDGRAALRASALKPLIVGRRDGRWYLRDPKNRVRVEEPRREPTEAELQANPFAGL